LESESFCRSDNYLIGRCEESARISFGVALTYYSLPNAAEKQFYQSLYLNKPPDFIARIIRQRAFNEFQRKSSSYIIFLHNDITPEAYELRKRNYPLLAYDSVFYIPEQLFLTRGVIVATTRPNGPAVGVVAMLGCPSSKNMATILSKNR
jgi:hypothetical protein